MNLVILIILILLVLGLVPAWPYNRAWATGSPWNYGPIGLILIILLLFLILRPGPYW